MKSFRKDVHSLRGLAIVSVAAFHTDLGLSGGFVGVDIFLVISGFLITSQLLDQVQQNPLRLASRFLVRRFWRLVPVAHVGVLATLAASLVVLSPFQEQESAFRTGRWSLIFLGNFELMLHADYWKTAQNPLIHMWSLGVEGQLYLVILTLVAASVFICKSSAESRCLESCNFLTFILIFSVLASFSLSLVSSYNLSIIPIAKNFAFFGSPTRVWEFLLGGLLALNRTNLIKLNERSANQLKVAGWLGIFIGILVAKPTSVFPGWIALLPVLGTTAIIASGTASGNSLRILYSRIPQHLGDISYSWYVVHFPVIIFFQILFPNSSITVRFLWLGLSYFLGLAMYFGVEKPMRRLTLETNKRQLIFGLTTISISFSGLLLIGVGSSTLRSSWIKPFYSGLRDEISLLGECLDSPIPADLSKNCVWNAGENTPRIVLLGDSQASSLASGAITAAGLVGAEIAVHSQGGCPFSSPDLKLDRCPSWDDRWKAIKNYKPDLLIVANAWTNYYDSLGFDLVSTLESEQLQTIFVHQAPYLGEFRESLASKYIIRASPKLEDRARQDATLSLLNQIADDHELIKIFNPETTLCPQSKCSFNLSSLRGAFWGNGHLAEIGSNRLAPDLANLISISLKTD